MTSADLHAMIMLAAISLPVLLAIIEGMPLQALRRALPKLVPFLVGVILSLLLLNLGGSPWRQFLVPGVGCWILAAALGPARPKLARAAVAIWFLISVGLAGHYLHLVESENWTGSELKVGGMNQLRMIAARQRGQRAFTPVRAVPVWHTPLTGLWKISESDRPMPVPQPASGPSSR